MSAPPLGFSVAELLPRARGGGRLKMGLAKLEEADWLQPSPDLTARCAAFAAHPEAVSVTPQAEAAGEELAAMLGTTGGLAGAAQSVWEDMCLLSRAEDEDTYRLIGAAVAFPSDWEPASKIGLPLIALHKPIHGYAEQLASGVDAFMAKLTAGPIYGRCNWFIAPVPDLRWSDPRPASEAFAHVTAANAGETLFVRCERQTLRRLPQSQAILFTIGIYVEPLAALPAEQIAWLAAALAAQPEAERQRRGAHIYGDALATYAAARERDSLHQIDLSAGGFAHD